MPNKTKRNYIFMHYTWWEITIFIIGSLSLLTIIATQFLPIGTGPTKYDTTAAIPAAGSLEFPTFLANSLTLPVQKGSTVEVLQNGDAFMNSFLQSIDNAHSSIDIMMYIWKDGKMSDAILSHAEAKLKQGVEVRIVIDGIGGTFASMDNFKKAGGKVIVYHAISPLPWNLAHILKRNHRRSIVIDGSIGYTGGIAVYDKWLGNGQDKDHYHDMMFKVTGNMASSLQGAFAELWAQGGEALSGNSFFPSITDTGTITYVPLSSTPSGDVRSLQKYFLLSFMSAQKSISIESPYLLLDPALSKTLEGKARQGLDVRVLVPNKLIDQPSVRNASRYGYEDLLKAGVKIYEYQPTFNHTKLLVVDNTWTVIGSANMDNRSRILNEENLIGISDPAFGSQMQQIFMTDLGSAQEINLYEWQKRNLWERIKEIFARKFVQQY